MPTLPPRTGAPCWIGLTTPDADASRAFYTGLFGWTAAEASSEFGGYFMFLRADGRPAAGAMPRPDGADWPIAWTVYLTTDDIAASLAAVRDAGGTVTADVMPIADLGSMAELIDPSGAAVGLWQADGFPGFAVQAELGAPGWFELSTRDYDAAVGFYRDALGWDAQTMSDTPEFRYTTLGAGDEARAGILDGTGLLPDGAPSAWGVYFAVEDVDAAVVRIADLGGTVTRAAADSPFGRTAGAIDPTGAAFLLTGPNIGG